MHALPDPPRSSDASIHGRAIPDPIARAAASACPPVPVRPAPVCQDVPSGNAAMCQDVPRRTPADVPECARTCPEVPESASAREMARTNPNPRALSDVQLAALRLIVNGFGSVGVARRLGVNHHTVSRWKRDPQFAAELDRLRMRVTDAAVAYAAQAGARRAPPATTTTGPRRDGSAGQAALLAKYLKPPQR